MSTHKSTKDTIVDPKATDIGVIIGRFQVHELHEAHKKLIQYVVGLHPRVIVFLGVAKALATRRNPLDFAARAAMLKQTFPTVHILPLEDQVTDALWSKKIDEAIRAIYPMGQATIYGGRSNSLDHYHGQFLTEELHQDQFVSGTDIRKHLSTRTIESADFRAGVIYGVFNKRPAMYSTVDVAVIDPTTKKILLARKPDEAQYRFIGGFCDKTDADAITTARREVMEEANISISHPEWLATVNIRQDWRYRDTEDGIMTTFFLAEYQFGAIEPKDDIAELMYFTHNDLFGNWEKIIAPVHHGLIGHLFMSSAYQRYHPLNEPPEVNHELSAKN